MSNFEAKHPRAKDGKFTEKLRAEAGMSLDSSAFSISDWPRKHVDKKGNTTLYWEDKPFTDLKPGERYLMEESTDINGYVVSLYKTSKGYEQDVSRSKDEDVRIRTYFDRNKQAVRKFNQPYWVERRDDGSTFERYDVDRDEVNAYLSAHGTKFNTRVLCSRVLRKDGTVSSEKHYRKTPDLSGNGEVIGEELDYYDDGAINHVRRFRIDGKPWDESITPSRQEYAMPPRPDWEV